MMKNIRTKKVSFVRGESRLIVSDILFLIHGRNQHLFIILLFGFYGVGFL